MQRFAFVLDPELEMSVPIEAIEAFGSDMGRGAAGGGRPLVEEERGLEVDAARLCAVDDVGPTIEVVR